MTRLKLVLTTVLILACALPAAAQDTVKWSAPMYEYPTQWAPTTPPPSYNNPWGYYPAYGGYGYGSYWGGAYAPGYQQGGQWGGQWSGNPYYGGYGQ